MVTILFASLSLFWSFLASASDGGVATETICHRFVQIEPTKKPSYSVPQCRVEGSILYWEGVVTDEVLYEMVIREKSNPIKKIHFNSYGGSTESAMEAAKYIHKNKIETHVRKGAVCMSACTLMFQAGINRTAHPRALFMYHPARWGNTWYQNWSDRCDSLRKKESAETAREQCRQDLVNFVFEVQEITDVFFGLLLKYGMKQEFLKDFMNRPIDEDWFKSGNFSRVSDWEMEAQDLIQYDIVEKLSEE